MNLISRYSELIPFNKIQQLVKSTQPSLDKSSAVLACLALNVIFSFAADKTINYWNHCGESPNEFIADPNDSAIQKNKYINSGVYLACMLIVNIVAISKLFSVSPFKPSLIIAPVLAVGRHVYRDRCEALNEVF